MFLPLKARPQHGATLDEMLLHRLHFTENDACPSDSIFFLTPASSEELLTGEHCHGVSVKRSGVIKNVDA